MRFLSLGSACQPKLEGVATASQDIVNYLEHGFDCGTGAQGRGSGAPAGTQATIFYTLADGLIARAEFEPGRSPQLEA
jgi:hypothetical protein